MRSGRHDSGGSEGGREGRLDNDACSMVISSEDRKTYKRDPSNSAPPGTRHYLLVLQIHIHGVTGREGKSEGEAVLATRHGSQDV